MVMPKPPDLLYLDSSVFGGCFDAEFSVVSNRLFEAVKSDKYRLATSELVEEELSTAPPAVLDLFDETLITAHVILVSEEAERLRQAYLDHHILAPKHSADALHVALASIGTCRAIISWNFKHIVQMDRIRLYNAVNLELGYNALAIHSPWEVVGNDRTISE
jgi:predicted nucleic acid-binding protein